MGNLGLSTALRDGADDSGYDVADLGEPLDRPSRLVRFRGRLIRSSLLAGVAFAFVNHWPGGH